MTGVATPDNTTNLALGLGLGLGLGIVLIIGLGLGLGMSPSCNESYWKSEVDKQDNEKNNLKQGGPRV